MELSRKIKDSCINFFQVPERYSEEQLAPHVVGYVDGTGHGVTGVELAMDDLLGRSSGEVTVYYQVDALGRVIPGAEKKIVDTLEETKAGVVRRWTVKYSVWCRMHRRSWRKGRW